MGFDGLVKLGGLHSDFTLPLSSHSASALPQRAELIMGQFCLTQTMV